MTKDHFFKYIKKEYGVEPEFPFDKGETAVFRHKNNRKWFAATLIVAKNKLGIESDEIVDILDIKIDPLLKAPLLEKKGFYPAYHMNKTHWITIVFSEADDEDIKTLVSMSYDVTKNKKKKTG